MNTAEILQAHDGRFRLDSSPACNKRCLTVEFSGVKILYSGSKLGELRV